MVGGAGDQGGAAARLTGQVSIGYDAAAATWADGPGRMYDPLARALIASAPVPLTGLRVLDLGAGTGVAGGAAFAAGARQVVAVDVADRMLRLGGHATRPVVADAARLPFRDRSFGLVVAAFCLNHLGDVAAGLAEARRVGDALAASVFAPGWTHPAKDAVDAVLRRSGYREPGWHAMLRPGTSDPGALARHAAAAGLTGVRVRTIVVGTGVATAAELVSWRLGMAHIAPFIGSLGPADALALRRAAQRAVAETGAGPLEVPMVVLTAR